MRNSSSSVYTDLADGLLALVNANKRNESLGALLEIFGPSRGAPQERPSLLDAVDQPAKRPIPSEVVTRSPSGVLTRTSSEGSSGSLRLGVQN